MKTNFKNIAIASTILVMPLKSVNTFQPANHTIKKVPKYSALVDLAEQNNKKIKEYVCTPLIKFQESELKRSLNIIKMPKPTPDLDVSKTKFVGHPEFLNMFLRGVMKGKGEQFIKAQEKHGINASFLVGIANLESGNGLSSFAIKRNNIAGMRNQDGYMSFESVDECIDRMAENLKRKYINDGLTTIKKINKRYAENPEWTELVIERMNPLYNASKCKVYDFNVK